MKTETKVLQRLETHLSQGKLKMTKTITCKLKSVHEAQHMFHTEHIVHIANIKVTPSKTVTFVNTMTKMQMLKGRNRLIQLLLSQIANVKLYQLLQSLLPVTTKVAIIVINRMKMLHTKLTCALAKMLKHMKIRTEVRKNHSNLQVDSHEEI